MVSGYLSREAVEDLLAVKQGEIDFVAKQRDEHLQTIQLLIEKQLLLLAQLAEIKQKTS